MHISEAEVFEVLGKCLNQDRSCLCSLAESRVDLGAGHGREAWEE